MRAIFFGTPAIAVPALEALSRVATVVGVVCQPDKPVGRGLVLTAPPVKQRALELGLEVTQPTKVRTDEFAQWMRDANADVALVMAYGRILPKAVLDAPRRGCMNLHASLLPRYRGAAPIARCIERGETETGICLMQMDEGCDTGPVYSRHVIAIDPEMTADGLAIAIAQLGEVVVREDLARAVDGALTAAPQDDSLATMAPMLTKAEGRIDWSRPAKQVHDHARAMTSWPGASTVIAGKTLKILATRVVSEEATSEPPGTVIVKGKGVEVACGQGSIAVLRAQLEGRKPLGAAELLAGRTLHAGAILGG